jgi:hypothetical protein
VAVWHLATRNDCSTLYAVAVWHLATRNDCRAVLHPVTGALLALGPAVDAKKSRVGNTSLGAPAPRLFGVDLAPAAPELACAHDAAAAYLSRNLSGRTASAAISEQQANTHLQQLIAAHAGTSTSAGTLMPVSTKPAVPVSEGHWPLPLLALPGTAAATTLLPDVSLPGASGWDTLLACIEMQPVDDDMLSLDQLESWPLNLGELPDAPDTLSPPPLATLQAALRNDTAADVAYHDESTR